MSRTVMLILAVSIAKDTEAFPALEQMVAETSQFKDAQIVAVFDRDAPENNYNPEVFAAHHEEALLRGYALLTPEKEKSDDNVQAPGPDQCYIESRAAGCCTPGPAPAVRGPVEPGSADDKFVADALGSSCLAGC